MKAKERLLIILLFVASSVFAIIYFRNSLGLFFDTNLKGGYYFSHQFDSQERWVNTPNKNEIKLKEDISLDGIRYTFRKKIDDRVILRALWGMPYKQIPNEYRNLSFIKLINDNQKCTPILFSKKIGYVIQDLTPYLKGKETLVFFTGRTTTHGNQNQEGDVLLRRIEVSVLPENFVVDLPLFLATILFPLLVVYFVILKANRKKTLVITRFVLLIILLWGIKLRWSEIERVSFAVPHPDAWSISGNGYRSFREKADNMKLFTAENGFYAVKDHHEPFYPLVAKMFFTIFGSSDFHLRFVSLFFSVLTIYLTYLVSKELFNDITALLPVMLVAFNQFLIEQSSFGLRTELEACFLLLLFYFCYLKRGWFKIWIWVILSGAIGAAWILTRSFNIPIVLFIIALSVFKINWRLRKKIIILTVIFSIAILPLVPYKYNMYKTYGDAFWDSNFYTTDAANMEFMGQPGFPKDKVTTMEYFFKLHSIKQIVNYHLIGMAVIFNCLSEMCFNIINEENHLIKMFYKDGVSAFNKHPLLTIKVLIFLFLTGLSVVYALFEKKFRIVLFLILLGTFHNAFAYGVFITKGRLIVTFYRQIAHVLPFFIYMISYTLLSLIFNLVGYKNLKFRRLGVKSTLPKGLGTLISKAIFP